MPLTTNINAYADVAAVLVAAQEQNGGVYTLDTKSDAIRWRARAYQYRKLLFERDGFTLYDTMVLTIRDETKVFIEFRKGGPGTLTSLDGEKVEVEEPSVEDPYEEAAAELMKELDGDA